MKKRTRRDDPTLLSTKYQEHWNNSSSILRLPEACLAHVISMASPLDTLRCSAVSTAFHAAAISDVTWERFLPAGYRTILARADHPVDFTSTKKELFLTLAQDHVILDKGTKSFWLEWASGAKCYMLSSRSLYIIWGESPLYWRRIYLPNSRFEGVAELIAVCWFDITGTIDSRELSPNTKYAAYLVFNLANETCGLDRPMEASILMGEQIVSAKHLFSLHPRTTQENRSGPAAAVAPEKPEEEDGDKQSYPSERVDGWMEVELGEFNNDPANGGFVTVRLSNVEDNYWKKGLLLEGMEIRQKKLT